AVPVAGPGAGNLLAIKKQLVVDTILAKEKSSHHVERVVGKAVVILELSIQIAVAGKCAIDQWVTAEGTSWVIFTAITVDKIECQWAVRGAHEELLDILLVHVVCQACGTSITKIEEVVDSTRLQP